tara:strand:- start:31705 stop:32442 length:738 start_codon:yes stop_codon:yes gene_type:complete
MFNNIGQVFMNTTNLFYEDKPHFFENLLVNESYKSLVSWQDIEDCLNNPHFYNFEMIDQHNNKIDIPMSEKAWEFGGKLVQDKQFLFNRFNTGNTLIIMNYGFHNKPITELLNNLEQMFDIHAAAHVYCGMQDTKSFTIHDDYPANFIFQIEGETEWTLFKNRISYLYKSGLMNGKLKEEDLEVELKVNLKPGDALYIPSRAYHCAKPKGERISVSVPCWNKLATDRPNTSVDRNIYHIHRRKNV